MDERRHLEYTVKDHSTFSSNFFRLGPYLRGQNRAGVCFSDRVNDPNDLDYRTGNNWFKLYESDVNGNGVKGVRRDRRAWQEFE